MSLASLKRAIVLSMTLTQIVSPGNAFAQSPSYEETLAFIQSKLSYPMVEDGHCQFIYNGYAKWSFYAGSLIDVPARVDVDNRHVTFNCARGGACVQDGNHNSYSASSIDLIPAASVDAQRIAKAMTHLIELCGGAAANDNLFK